MARAREKFCKKVGTGSWKTESGDDAVWKMESRDDGRYSGKLEERSRKRGKKRRGKKEWQYDGEYVRRRQGKSRCFFHRSWPAIEHRYSSPLVRTYRKLMHQPEWNKFQSVSDQRTSEFPPG